MAINAIEGAVAFAILGSLAAVAIPAFSENMHASRSTEAVDGLAKISTKAISNAAEKPIPDAFPPSVPLAPPEIARGDPQVDPPGTWDSPTWKALDFRASPEGVPHRFSFGFQSTSSATYSAFVAEAHADQDGDGLTSTFEVRGHDDAQGAVADPGMFVDHEIE
ncbi:MAG: hypothetical protein ACRELY_32060 [Polyangiaceae bacterium]